MASEIQSCYAFTFRLGFRILLFITICLAHLNAHALEADEILVIANQNMNTGIALAQYYMLKRAIPEKNLITLNVTTNETCSRADYDTRIAEPVREFLKKYSNNKYGIRCLVLVFGVPLKISSSVNSSKNLTNKSIDSKNKILNLPTQTTRASIDSEIALLLLKDHPLAGWIPNPYYLGLGNRKVSIGKEDIFMVSRLDGPSAHIVRRIIDDSIYAENNGLDGIAYFDARWPLNNTRKLSGYDLYDNSIHRAASRVRKSALSVVVNDSSELFGPGECPDASLYCGWYSLANYVDSFTWKRGAIGYHIASEECVTLKRKDSRVWCKMMLEKGVAATIGPVGEPYVQAFPMPEIFFGFLVDGYLTLAECYLISNPFLSWKMVLIGDPLYRPFYKNIKHASNFFSPKTIDSYIKKKQRK